MKIVDSPICRLCNSNEETINHLFCDCDPVKQLWHDFQNWFLNVTNHVIVLNSKIIILGLLEKDMNYYSVNALILVTKSYIFYCAKNNIIPTFVHLYHRFITLIREQKALYKLQNKECLFTKRWQSFLRLLD